ncbi:MAG: hypothetical protein HY741_27125 [Chloroflexi bacterium]|nr:hypothetical protein [Chloroflexota bacterium]
MKAFLHRPFTIHLLVLCGYGVLTLAMTFPLALHLGDQLLGTDSNALNDTYFSVWIFGWQAHQLIADPLNLFQGNIFFPFQNTLAFSEIILPGALLYLPFAYASHNPVFAYNLVLWLTFPLNAFAMYLYALDWVRRETTDDRQWTANSDKRDEIREARNNTPVTRHSDAPSRTTRNWSNMRDDASPSPVTFPAFLAGLIFAFCTYKFGELRHVQLLMAMFMPLTLLYLARFVRTPNLRNAILTALFFALNALASLYYAVFLAFAAVLYLGVDLARRRYRITRAHLLYGAAAVGIAVILVTPFMLPFLRLEREFNFSEERDPRLFSARPYSYIAAPASQWLYGNLTRAFYVASKGQPLFPGITTSLLGLVGVVALLCGVRRTQQISAWIFPVLLALMGFVLSFGPDLVLGRTTAPALPFPLPYHFLALVVSPLKSLNAPSRFAVLTMLALALLAAYGARAWMRRAPRWRSVIALACATLIVLEYIPAPLRLVPVQAGANVSPVYSFLAQQPQGAVVVELPMGKPTFADQDKYVVYTYSAVYHPLQPLVNGYSTLLPPDYYALVRDVQKFPSNRTVNRLRRWGAQWVIVHADAYGRPKQLREKLDALRGLEHVQDFDEVWLYRIGNQ